MVYVCAQEQLASWKVTECEPDDSYSRYAGCSWPWVIHTCTHIHNTQASKLFHSHRVLYTNVSGNPLIYYCVSQVLHPHIHTCDYYYALPQSLTGGRTSKHALKLRDWSECSHNIHGRLERKSEIREPLPELFALGLCSCSSWLINLRVTGG